MDWWMGIRDWGSGIGDWAEGFWIRNLILNGLSTASSSNPQSLIPILRSVPTTSATTRAEFGQCGGQAVENSTETAGR